VHTCALSFEFQQATDVATSALKERAKASTMTGGLSLGRRRYWLAVTRHGHRPHPFNDSRFGGREIPTTNRNFGCGSSGTHAPCPSKRFETAATIGDSFGRIFAGDCVSIGVPYVTPDLASMRVVGTSAHSRFILPPAGVVNVWSLLRAPLLYCSAQRTRSTQNCGCSPFVECSDDSSERPTFLRETSPV
jgi:hypothetical protein